jgi:hypothetical protein
VSGNETADGALTAAVPKHEVKDIAGLDPAIWANSRGSGTGSVAIFVGLRGLTDLAGRFDPSGLDGCLCA